VRLIPGGRLFEAVVSTKRSHVRMGVVTEWGGVSAATVWIKTPGCVRFWPLNDEPDEEPGAVRAEGLPPWHVLRRDHLMVVSIS
jgi:hypothetical protein